MRAFSLVLVGVVLACVSSCGCEEPAPGAEASASAASSESGGVAASMHAVNVQSAGGASVACPSGVSECMSECDEPCSEAQIEECIAEEPECSGCPTEKAAQDPVPQR